MQAASKQANALHLLADCSSISDSSVDNDRCRCCRLSSADVELNVGSNSSFCCPRFTQRILALDSSVLRVQERFFFCLLRTSDTSVFTYWFLQIRINSTTKKMQTFISFLISHTVQIFLMSVTGSTDDTIRYDR